MKRVFVVANPDKPNVAAALAELRPWLAGVAELVGVQTDSEQDLAHLDADLVLVLGGDGTLLSAARRMAARQVPLMGVNFGRLGFLADFTPQNYREYLIRHLTQGLPVNRRAMLDVSVLPPDVPCQAGDCAQVAATRRFVAPALNDAVVTAGPPFHMVELEISADAEQGIKYFGDGVIVATSAGSTAYNVSAGGPIIDAGVEAFCITPICPHSLSFRPVVVSSHSTVAIRGVRVNEGTTLFCDGQASTRLLPGERVVIRRGDHDALLIDNPDTRHWASLAEKLNWAASPKYAT
jgi:NAD+ kinase